MGKFPGQPQPFAVNALPELWGLRCHPLLPAEEVSWAGKGPRSQIHGAVLRIAWLFSERFFSPGDWQSQPPGRAVLSNPLLYPALNAMNLLAFLQDLHLQQDPLAPSLKKKPC